MLGEVKEEKRSLSGGCSRTSKGGEERTSLGRGWV